MQHRLITLSLLAIATVSPACAQEAQDTDDTLIATVNGQPYELDLFRAFYGERLQQSGGQNSAQLQEQAFNEFMNLIVASQEGKERNLADSPQVQTALELQRMMVLSAAALQAIGAESDPTEKELKQAYDQFVEQSQRTEYKARHILVDDKEKAQSLIEQLNESNGKGFEDLAEEHSLGPTAEKGGDLGWFDSRRMVKPFADAVAEMEPGTYSQKPVQTQFGWHVIRLEETRAAEPPSFEEAKPQLEAQVRRQKVANALAEMRGEADIELNEEVVKVKENASDED
ncbi:MAG: peptidylprolyl isomerase [Gammaproteobacteria bacterium]|jgi:peptidyl-prolyl cis-trans isomerase C|nr:peptidylprolyl isomerase [Gammaproteobacteria bacterium]